MTHGVEIIGAAIVILLPSILGFLFILCRLSDARRATLALMLVLRRAGSSKQRG